MKISKKYSQEQLDLIYTVSAELCVLYRIQGFLVHDMSALIYKAKVTDKLLNWEKKLNDFRYILDVELNEIYDLNYDDHLIYGNEITNSQDKSYINQIASILSSHNYIKEKAKQWEEEKK